MRAELPIIIGLGALWCLCVLDCASGGTAGRPEPSNAPVSDVGDDAGAVNTEEADVPVSISEAPVSELLEKRRAALSSGDFDLYAALLAKNFEGSLFDLPEPKTFDREAWVKNRRDHLRKGTNIELQDIEIEISDESAQVRCHQHLSRSRFEESGTLELRIVSEGGHLKIDREHVRVVIVALEPRDSNMGNRSNRRNVAEVDEVDEVDEVERSNCRPPAGRRRHCILLDLSFQDLSRKQALIARLRAEGYDTGIEGSGLAMDLTPQQILRLFGARVIYRGTEMSSRPGTACNAYLSGGQVPARYQDDITSFYVGHQICE